MEFPFNNEDCDQTDIQAPIIHSLSGRLIYDLCHWVGNLERLWTRGAGCCSGSPLKVKRNGQIMAKIARIYFI
jgi:hypothetical protein